jgi:diketogulonate reductase-like aldo/keto reductase
MADRSSPPIPQVVLADGTRVPALGQGTWHMGESRRSREREAAALCEGIELGMTQIDTAEMYASGGAEEVVAEAIAGIRERVFVVSKVLPQNAGSKSAIAACERSLRRLRTDYIDLYLLHWRSHIPLAETVAAFERLRADGKIMRWGVSNFDVGDLQELLSIAEGKHVSANQVLYHLAERGIEWRLAAQCRERAIAVMAYSPLGEGDLLDDPRLARIANDAGIAPAQLALAWMLQQPNVITIPKSGSLAHVRENRAAADLRLSATTMSVLDRAFPPPKRARPLAVL